MRRTQQSSSHHLPDPHCRDNWPSLLCLLPPLRRPPQTALQKYMRGMTSHSSGSHRCAVPFEARRKTHQGFAKCFVPGGATRAEKDRASSCSVGRIELGPSQSPGVILCIPEEALGSAYSHIYCYGGACTHNLKFSELFWLKKKLIIFIIFTLCRLLLCLQGSIFFSYFTFWHMGAVM